MVRMQIRLTDEQARALKELAAREGVSMTQLVRRSVQRLVEGREEAEKWRRAMAIVGRYSADPEDVAANHDQYLDEAYSK